jgi:hypothetical protein
LPPLEIETYAFDVLPREHRASTLADEITRELAFVSARLGRDLFPINASL